MIVMCIDIWLECLSETLQALDVLHHYWLEYVHASSVRSKADGYSFFRSLGATDRTSCECPVRSKLVEQPGLVEVVNIGWVVIGEKLLQLLTTGGNLGYISAVAFSVESITGYAASGFKHRQATTGVAEISRDIQSLPQLFCFLDDDIIVNNTTARTDVSKPQKQGVFKLFILRISCTRLGADILRYTQPFVRRMHDVSNSRLTDFYVFSAQACMAEYFSCGWSLLN